MRCLLIFIFIFILYFYNFIIEDVNILCRRLEVMFKAFNWFVLIRRFFISLAFIFSFLAIIHL
jgi:hypothetical protein